MTTIGDHRSDAPQIVLPVPDTEMHENSGKLLPD